MQSDEIQRRAETVLAVLDQYFPEVDPPLDYQDPFTMLVAVLLSAQCTDARVNQVTPVLFAEGSTPQSMLNLGYERIEEVIRPCGISKNKAKAIVRLSEMLIADHNGQVPSTFAALESLPGVGHKTASVVMVQAFGVPAFPVDTHILRVAKRWGLSNHDKPEGVEADLKKLVPEKDWGKVHLQMIYFGRVYCKATGHIESQCPMCSVLKM